MVPELSVPGQPHTKKTDSLLLGEGETKTVIQYRGSPYPLKYYRGGNWWKTISESVEGSFFS